MSRLLLFTLLIAPLFSACGGLGGEPDIIATVAPQSAVPPTEPITSDWQPNIVNGAAIFVERCVECHGSSGDGRGDLVLAGSVKQPIDMTDRAVVAAKSPLAWYEIITEGRIENLMPPWQDALSEIERWDVALYSYTLGYDDTLLDLGERVWQEQCGDCEFPAAIPPVFSDNEYAAALNHELFAGVLREKEIPAAAAFARMQSLNVANDDVTAPIGDFTGRLEHGTAGGSIPADTVVQLQYGNSDDGFSLVETTINDDLSFRFENVPLSGDFSYLVGALYGERLFSRRLPAGHSAASDYDQTIMIYDVTSDPFVVSIAQIDFYIDPVKLQDIGERLQISQVIRFRNKSDRIYTSGRGFDDGREATLLVQSPNGAAIMSGDAGGRYVVIEDMAPAPNAVIDTLPVPPGDSHQLILEYFLPYDDGALYEQELNNMIDADMTVTLTEGLRLDSDSLRLDEQRDPEDGLSVYSGKLKIEGEPRISFGISGDPFATSSDDRAVITSENLAPLLAGAVAIALALLAGLRMLHRRKTLPSGEIEGLAQELARLDDDHDQGRINHDLYHHRRRELKAKLAQLMDAGTGEQ